MPLPNHSALELSVYDMVLTRLPFLEDTTANTEISAQFTLEMMSELEPCFRVDDVDPIPDPSNIGNEEKYTMAQRVVLADLVSYYMLLRFSIVNTAGDSSDTSTIPATSFLKSAKAGSVAVEFEQIDVKKSQVLVSTIDRLLGLFKDSATRKARALGCVIDICDSCVAVLSCLLDPRPAMFKVADWNVPPAGSNNGVTEQA